MVVKSGVIAAYDEFKHSLEEFVREDEREYVDVFESDPGILWASIGTEKFRDVPSTTRQELIWEHLSKSLSPEARRYCWGVQCMDVTEYRESVVRRISGSVGLFSKGSSGEDVTNA